MFRSWSFSLLKSSAWNQDICYAVFVQPRLKVIFIVIKGERLTWGQMLKMLWLGLNLTEMIFITSNLTYFWCHQNQRSTWGHQVFNMLCSGPKLEEMILSLWCYFAKCNWWLYFQQNHLKENCKMYLWYLILKYTSCRMKLMAHLLQLQQWNTTSQQWRALNAWSSFVNRVSKLTILVKSITVQSDGLCPFCCTYDFMAHGS